MYFEQMTLDLRKKNCKLFYLQNYANNHKEQQIQEAFHPWNVCSMAAF